MNKSWICKIKMSGSLQIRCKVIKKIKEKKKKMHELYNKAGDSYKVATYEYMKKLIKSEQVDTSFLDTYLTQQWKGKGSALELFMAGVGLEQITCI